MKSVNLKKITPKIAKKLLAKYGNKNIPLINQIVYGDINGLEFKKEVDAVSEQKKFKSTSKKRKPYKAKTSE